MRTHVQITQCSYKRKWTGSLTKLEFCLLCTIGLLILTLIAICYVWLIILDGSNVIHNKVLNSLIHDDQINQWAHDRTAIHSQKLVCTSKECTRLAALFSSNMDEKIDPCEDFYEFACGNYDRERELPAGKPLRHTIIDAQTVLNKQVRQVLETDITDRDTPWDRMSKTYYAKCMDEDRIERNGKEDILSLLGLIGKWPVLHDKWEEYDNLITHLSTVFNKTAVSSIFFELTVSHDLKNSSKTVIELDQPKFGIGSRWPYMNGINDNVVKNYTEMAVKTAVLLGADRKRAEIEMKEMIELEIQLVGKSADEADRGEPDRGNNPISIKQLKRSYPEIDFVNFIKTIFDGFADINDEDIVVVRELIYFKSLQSILKSASKRTISNYIGWRVVQGYSLFLPMANRQIFYDFKANLTGMTHMPNPERWLDCVNLAVMLFDMPVGKLFVENFFDEKFALPKIEQMTSYFKSTFIRQLQELTWMDEKTKRKAIKKSHMIQYKSGYPNEIFNHTWMNENWNLPPTSPKESIFYLTLRVKQKRSVDELSKYKKPVDRSFWYQSPAQVDAFYAPNLNEMIFPAGIMQFPFLTSNVPNYATFAMIGAVISHELTHAFCSQGSRYDEYGSLNDWWDTETAGKYFDNADCFVRQYDDEQIKELGGQRLNGKLSLGENIADNGGVKTAFRAYSSWKTSNGKPEASLPGLQKYSNEQLFFISYANNWCSMIHPQYAGQLLTGDVHAPARLRAVVPLRNRPEFSKVFGCPLGSPMNPKKKCSLW